MKWHGKKCLDFGHILEGEQTQFSDRVWIWGAIKTVKNSKVLSVSNWKDRVPFRTD